MGSEIITKSDSANLDLLVFRVGGRKYGINIAKVKEIVNYSTLTSVPRTHPYIEGIFMPRDAMISVVDMRRVFQCGVSEPCGSIIITSFNSLNMAFHVDSVAGIFSGTAADAADFNADEKCPCDRKRALGPEDSTSYRR